MESVSAFVVILGPDAEPELVRNSIRLIAGVASMGALIELELPRDEDDAEDAEADGPPCTVPLADGPCIGPAEHAGDHLVR